MKVDFLLIGAQKCGTTALAQFLAQHPEICMPDEKELHFFDNDARFDDPVTDYAAYHDHFRNCSEEARMYGEATPIYMYWQGAMERIQEYRPDIKLVVILRNPIERAYSQYIMEMRRGNENWSFGHAIRFERLRRFCTWGRKDRIISYVNRGFYARQIKRLLRLFEKKQILFIRTEDLLNLHEETVKKVLKFLGLPANSIASPEKVFTNTYEPMSDADHEYLRRRYKKDIHELEELLQWDCSNWHVRQ